MKAKGEKLIGQMNRDEFDKLIGNFIETQSGSDDPLLGEAFFELWAEIEREKEQRFLGSKDRR